jgi:ankyrin repeat domain-containing protein 50
LVRDILAGLIRQALERCPNLVQLVYALYTRHVTELTKPTQQELVDVLVDVSKSFKQFYLGIDGLDEAADSDAQFDLVTILSTLEVRFFITSRPLQGLETLVPNAEHFTIIADRHEIDLLLNQRLERNPTFRQLTDSLGSKLDKQTLSKAIFDKSEGMCVDEISLSSVLIAISFA